jgi:hypothetical protein
MCEEATVGITRKFMSVLSMGVIDFQSDKERMARSARLNKRATKRQNRLIKEQNKLLKRQQG